MIMGFSRAQRRAMTLIPEKWRVSRKASMRSYPGQDFEMRESRAFFEEEAMLSKGMK